MSWENRLRRLRETIVSKNVQRYFAAFVAVTAGEILRNALAALLGPGLPPYVMFYPSVVFVALMAGLGPGILATFLSLLVITSQQLTGFYQVSLDSPADRFGLLVFAITCLAISVFSDQYGRYRIKGSALEKALEENRDRLRFALEAGNTGAWDLDLIDQSALRSLRHDQIFGYETLQPNWSFEIFLSHVLPDFREEVRQKFEDAVAKGIDWSFECKIRRRDGEIRWIWATGRHQLGTDRRPSRMAGIVQDITERKDAEDALRRSERLYRAIGESINYGIWVCDATGRNIYASESFLKLVGMTQQQCADFGWGNVLHPDDVESTIAAWNQCVRTGGTWDVEHRYKGVDGLWHPILARGVPVRDENGQVQYWAGINLDIGRLKSVEADLARAKLAADAASTAKSQFLANMSHEIRTPLGVIIGFANLIADPTLSVAERRHFSDIIFRNSAQLTALIDDILDLSRIESGKVSLNLRIVNMDSLLADVRTCIIAKAEIKGVRFQTNVADIPPEILTDSSRLLQILTNITSNAIKFTPAGGSVTLNVDYHKELDSIDFIITDTGIGIPPESQRIIFEPFTQADLTTSQQFGGTGLGLTLSRNLARALGGDVVLQSSTPGNGSTFIVRIPVRSAQVLAHPEAMSLNAKIQMPSIGAELAGLNVLLAEDAEENALLVSRILESRGARVDIVGNGLEAVEKASVNDYDAILMDMRMPAMDGLTATKALRASGFRAPIIALTANALKEDYEASISAGCTHHLTKPINLKELISILSKLRSQ